MMFIKAKERNLTQTLTAQKINILSNSIALNAKCYWTLLYYRSKISKEKYK